MSCEFCDEDHIRTASYAAFSEYRLLTELSSKRRTTTREQYDERILPTHSAFLRGASGPGPIRSRRRADRPLRQVRDRRPAVCGPHGRLQERVEIRADAAWRAHHAERADRRT